MGRKDLIRELCHEKVSSVKGREKFREERKKLKNQMRRKKKTGEAAFFTGEEGY